MRKLGGSMLVHYSGYRLFAEVAAIAAVTSRESHYTHGVGKDVLAVMRFVSNSSGQQQCRGMRCALPGYASSVCGGLPGLQRGVLLRVLDDSSLGDLVIRHDYEQDFEEDCNCSNNTKVLPILVLRGQVVYYI